MSQGQCQFLQIHSFGHNRNKNFFKFELFDCNILAVSKVHSLSFYNFLYDPKTLYFIHLIDVKRGKTHKYVVVLGEKRLIHWTGQRALERSLDTFQDSSSGFAF